MRAIKRRSLLLLWACIVSLSLGVIPSTAQANMLRNPQFSKFSWKGIAIDWANNSWGNLQVEFEADRGHTGRAQSIRCTRFSSGAVQFVQPNVVVKKNRSYEISVWLKGTVDVPVKVLLRKRGRPYTVYAAKTFRVSEAWRRYTFTATSARSDGDAYLMIRFAGTGALSVDDASLTDVTDKTFALSVPAEENLISNGSFEVGRDRWGVQIREAGGARYAMPVHLKDDRPRVDSTKSRFGRRSLLIPIPQHGKMVLTSPYVRVNPGRSYTLSLWLMSSRPRKARIGIASGRPGNSVGHYRTVTVGSKWQKYSLTGVLKPVDENAYYVILTSTGSGKIWVDGVQLMQGAPSGFQPHAPAEIGLVRDGIPTLYTIGSRVSLRADVADYSTTANYQIQIYSESLSGMRKVLANKQLHLKKGQEKSVPFGLPAHQPGYYKVVATISTHGRTLDRSEMAFGILYPRTRAPTKRSPFGNHIRFNDRSLAEARMLGVSWLRMHPPLATTWPVVEPERGHFDFEDKAIELAHKRGFFLLGSLYLTPRWASSAADSGVAANRYVPKNLADWRRYVYRTVKHYRGLINYWEVWNEPNSAAQLRIPGLLARYRRPKVYVDLLRVAYKAAKRANPQAVIVGGCSTGQPPAKWAAEILSLGALKYLDVLSYHRYTNGLPADVLGITARELAEQIRQAMRHYGGKTKPIWETESGVMDPPTNYNNILEVNPNAATTPRQAADYVVRNYVDLLAAGVSKWFYYDMFTAGRIDRPDGTGFFEWDGSPRPLAIAYANLEHFVDGLKFSRRLEVGKHAVGVEFQGGGRRVDILWAKGWGDGLDTGVNIPPAAGHEVRKIYNMMGDLMVVHGNALRVGHSPVYVSYGPSS